MQMSASGCNDKTLTHAENEQNTESKNRENAVVCGCDAVMCVVVVCEVILLQEKRYAIVIVM